MMTKEELYARLHNEFIEPLDFNADMLLSICDEFFKDKVIIQRSDNRHPYADVLHEFIEGAKCEYRDTLDPLFPEKWCEMKFPTHEYRIKPKEPIYEAKVRMFFIDGKSETTERYFTLEEFNRFGFPMSCVWDEETKQERKQ